MFTKQDIPALLVVEGCRSFVKSFVWYTKYINIYRQTRPYAITLINVYCYFDTILLLSSFQLISPEISIGFPKIAEIHQNEKQRTTAKVFRNQTSWRLRTDPLRQMSRILHEKAVPSFFEQFIHKQDAAVYCE